MKQGKIYLYNQYVGLLTEDETGFTFAYDADYLASSQAEAVSLTLPLSNEPYHDTVLFPFFDGLIPEGWLLNIAESSWKINHRYFCSIIQSVYSPGDVAEFAIGKANQAMGNHGDFGGFCEVHREVFYFR